MAISTVDERAEPEIGSASALKARNGTGDRTVADLRDKTRRPEVKFNDPGCVSAQEKIEEGRRIFFFFGILCCLG